MTGKRLSPREKAAGEASRGHARSLLRGTETPKGIPVCSAFQPAKNCCRPGRTVGETGCNILTLWRIPHYPDMLMIRSMTGFGRGEARGEAASVSVEARSVNARHLDVALRLPRALTGLEPEARRIVQARLERGRVEVTVTLVPFPGASTPRLVVDESRAREYLAHARRLGEGLGVENEVSLGWILERPGVIRIDDAEPATEAIGAGPVTEAI